MSVFVISISLIHETFVPHIFPLHRACSPLIPLTFYGTYQTRSNSQVSARPPSTMMTCPVTKSVLAKYATAPAMSSPVPVLSKGAR